MYTTNARRILPARAHEDVATWPALFFLKETILAVLLVFIFISAHSQKIIGYATSWSGNAGDIPYSCLSHINYAFALPSPDGHLRPIENVSKLQSLVQFGHAAGVKVLISVGGWSDENGPLDPVFENIGNNAAYRTNLINDIVNFIDDYNLDGADIDWEYPDAGSSARNYDSLMTGLYRHLHPDGKLVTTAVAGNSWGGAGIGIYIKNVADWINIMGYDFNSYQHSTYSESIAGVQYYQAKGFPDSQLALGVPFYGRNSWESFADLVKRGADPYADTFDGIGYNGINTIHQKADYIKDNGLAGIMIWELSQDLDNEYSLLTCICNTFNPASHLDDPDQAGLKIYPNPFHDYIRLTSAEKILEIQFFDIQGRLLYKISPRDFDVEINLSGYSSGMFFMDIKLNGKTARFKILKM